MENTVDGVNGIEDEYVKGRMYLENPMLPILGDILKRKGKKELYEKVHFNRKIRYLMYSNKQDVRDIITMYLDDIVLADLYSLSSSGLKLLFFIMKELPKHSDHIVLSRDKFLNKVGFKSNVYYKSLKELIEHEWLFESPSNNMYWINVNRFTKGTPVDTFKYHELRIAKEKIL